MTFHQVHSESAADYHEYLSGIWVAKEYSNGGMTRLGGGFVKWTEEQTMHSAHKHDEVIVVLEGAQHTETQDGAFIAYPGDVIVVRGGTNAVHYSEPGTKTSYVLALDSEI
ncbi:MAG: hypothetical protein QM611_09085 [Microbacterium sp.]|uniref:hypothetical protein n=1 Tax=Microbacterium sp. TaxID=51671 RepID=UPI0039E3BC74